ncbi:hypothetical protein Glove_60g39 [Diversispora epigaea]|uniref:Uncharacterized protein n=1 Tax=Diversispora epigaea TaxID=1348612 RepID=A0A397JBS1_9GLOM|nr:hypothetical protein Glove_60g39 [Diversispora epigaea]
MLIVNELEFNGLTVKLETHLIETKSSCSDFISFSESLVSLLKRDDFKISELSVREKEPFSNIITNERGDECVCSSNFWDTCHDNSHTVVIMKFEGADKIFGEYNPLA